MLQQVRNLYTDHDVLKKQLLHVTDPEKAAEGPFSIVTGGLSSLATDQSW